MKKVYSLILAATLILVIPIMAFATSGKAADVDLSKMSYDDLVELKDRINLAIWESDEWQEVEVPHGVWQVGKDIPAGRWTIRAGENCSLFLSIGETLDSSKTSLVIDSSFSYWVLMDKNNKRFDPTSDIESVTIDLQDGIYVTINEGYVIFSPYSGQPDLGFRK